jgi:hypothetical protein
MSYAKLQRIRESGKLVQICPSCPNIIEVNDQTLASFIQKYGCADCRWKEAESEAVASEAGTR